MRAPVIRGALGVVLVVPWIAAVACGGEQPPTPATPLVVEAPIVSASSAAPTSESTPIARASASPPPAESGSGSLGTLSASEDDSSLTAKGTMWGEAIGDSFGAGGIGLSGSGVDGGARRGLGDGRLSSGSGSSPTLRQGATTVTGRLPPEVIQRIVRQNFGRFRLCYEKGLRTNPNLAGRVTVTFVIDGGGAVKSTKDGGSSMSDAGVVKCVVQSFANFSFPQPDKGEVTVSYPIIFSPGDTKPAASTSPSSSAKH